MNQVASIQALRQPPPAEMQMPQVSVGLTNLQGFELAQRAAKLLASSTLVPKEYQGNLPNCVIALNMAQRVGADPLMVMQNLVIVHGRPTWSAQFLIATVNTCGRFSALRFEFFGERNTDEWGCRAWAIEKATGEKLVGSDVTIGIAKKEGWYGKNGSKWQSIPQQMLMYRAGGWWTRAFAPELSMGLQTADEAGDIYDATPDASGTYSVSMDDLHRTEASIEQQAAQEAPAAAAPMDVDPRTGEVIGNDEADHSPDELGLQDALAAIKEGDLVLAQDIARGLSETDRAIVDQAIENKRTTRRRPAAGLDLE
ncbi:hypothetical protein LHK_01792 [Laribacter hongkongensis HLHK9]|uniref:RecT family protein n=1 Tax=Laribacter hongkongensis (strain HLHK9) TaxID=557598 RepID=C1D8I6_LARHH|nr:hypothetical protein [Laribacter hongkongensis]ACO74776.1 hypothetical protein LHK_01792 [Laribacter hongkongensis HLHK9]